MSTPRRVAAISIFGAGSFGSALAVNFARSGVAVVLWGRDGEQIKRMRREGCNTRYLPGVSFPANITLTDDLDEAVLSDHELLVCVPSHAFRDVVHELARRQPLHALTWATKGLEPGSGRLLNAVVTEAMPHGVRCAVLSGPTFAAEVAQGLPTAVTLASCDIAHASALATQFSSASFRIYASDDLVGVQVCGGVKNVLAIAAGISDGLGFGANARAALVTRGLAELSRLGVALGGRVETFMGLAGLGDLMLTSTDDQSRNRRFGLALAGGATSEQAQRALGQVVEGSSNTREVNRLAASVGVEMPIAYQVDQVLHHAVSPRDAVQELMTRALRKEIG